MNKQDWISQKIKKLKAEGKSQAQSVAIALSMAEDKYQMGGYINPQPASNNTWMPLAPYLYNEPVLRPTNDMYPPTAPPNIGAPSTIPYTPSPESFGINYMTPPPYSQQSNEEVLALMNQDNTRYNTTINRELFNPYTGVSLEGALFNLGRSLSYDGEQKGWNTVRGIASGGKALFAGARNVLAGAANQNTTQDSYRQYIDRLYNTAPVYNYMQEGGEVTNAGVMTGAYVVDQPVFNVELENNEQVLNSQTGQVQETVGETHEQGGVKTQLPEGSKVLSDHTKIGAKNAKYFRNELDLKVKATDTYAKVMDKYNNKIGWNELIQEEEKTIEEIGNQEQSSIPADTRDINLNFLSTKLTDIQAEKEQTIPLQQETFNKIFNKQENLPNEEGKMQMGGSMYDPTIIALAEQYNLPAERVWELVQATIIPQMQAGGTFFNPQYRPQINGVQPFVGENTNAAGLTSEEEILARLQYQNEVLPFIVRQSGIYSDNAGAFPNLANTASFQERYDRYVNQVIPEIDNNEFLTPEEKEQYKQLAQAELLGVSNQNGQYDNIYGLETSSRSSFSLPFLTAEDREKYPEVRFVGDIIDDKGNVKPEYAQLDPATQERVKATYSRGGEDILNLGLGTIPTTEVAEIEQTPVTDTTAAIQNRTVTEYSIPNLPVDFILPPSGAQPVLRQQANLSRLTPVKQTAEPYLANIEAQTQAAIEGTSYLPDAQRAAVAANMLGTSQQASNQAIGQVEAANMQSQQQINQFNAGQADKEQLLNLQLNQDYQDKMYATLGNTERDLRLYFQDLNNQQFSNFNYIDRRNLLNQATPQYFTSGSNIMFQDNAGNIVAIPNTMSNLTPEQRALYTKEWLKSSARNAAKINR